MSKPLWNEDATIYNEMMVHPAFFTHPNPKKIVLMNENNSGILEEVLKHTELTEILHIAKDKISVQRSDRRITHYLDETSAWFNQAVPHAVDIVIIATSHITEYFEQYLNSLHSDGILIQQCDSPFQLSSLKTLQKKLLNIGFSDIQVLHFPQSNFLSGWRSAIMAVKSGGFKRLREKDIFNKSFSTYYYNFDMHKAALAIPEFMRKVAEVQNE